MPRAFLSAALACTALSACASPTAPRMLPTTVSTSRSSAPPPPVSASVAGNTVVVAGAITLNVPCYEFSAATSAEDNSLVVTLVASPLSGACITIVVADDYTITIRDVPPGSWHLRLIHDFRGSSPSTSSVFDTQIVVQ